MATLRAAADVALEASVVGSFSRLGPAVRSRLFGWSSPPSLHGRVVAVTGATAGLGRQMAGDLAALGADLVLLVRDPVRGRRLAVELAVAHGVRADVIRVDMGDLDAVRAAAAELLQRSQLDVLIHNAGSLSATRTLTPQGNEQTVAVQVPGPLLLSSLVLPLLHASDDGRVIVVTSGGMYTQPLAALDAEPVADDGVAAYARAKRAQVSLVAHLAPRLRERGVLLTAYHPGWADTDGLRRSLPRFYAVMRPLLRSPAMGADTAVYLAAARRQELGDGVLWLDRAPRALHRLPRTRRSDTADARERLLQCCLERCGLSPAAHGALSA